MPLTQEEQTALEQARIIFQSNERISEKDLTEVLVDLYGYGEKVAKKAAKAAIKEKIEAGADFNDDYDSSDAGADLGDGFGAEGGAITRASLNFGSNRAYTQPHTYNPAQKPKDRFNLKKHGGINLDARTIRDLPPGLQGKIAPSTDVRTDLNRRRAQGNMYSIISQRPGASWDYLIEYGEKKQGINYRQQKGHKLQLDKSLGYDMTEEQRRVASAYYRSQDILEMSDVELEDRINDLSTQGEIDYLPERKASFWERSFAGSSYNRRKKAAQGQIDESRKAVGERGKEFQEERERYLPVAKRFHGAEEELNALAVDVEEKRRRFDFFKKQLKRRPDDTVARENASEAADELGKAQDALAKFEKTFQTSLDEFKEYQKSYLERKRALDDAKAKLRDAQYKAAKLNAGYAEFDSPYEKAQRARKVLDRVANEIADSVDPKTGERISDAPLSEEAQAFIAGRSTEDVLKTAAGDKKALEAAKYSPKWERMGDAATAKLSPKFASVGEAVGGLLGTFPMRIAGGLTRGAGGAVLSMFSSKIREQNGGVGGSFKKGWSAGWSFNSKAGAAKGAALGANLASGVGSVVKALGPVGAAFMGVVTVCKALYGAFKKLQSAVENVVAETMNLAPYNGRLGALKGWYQGRQFLRTQEYARDTSQSRVGLTTAWSELLDTSQELREVTANFKNELLEATVKGVKPFAEWLGKIATRFSNFVGGGKGFFDGVRKTLGVNYEGKDRNWFEKAVGWMPSVSHLLNIKERNEAKVEFTRLKKSGNASQDDLEKQWRLALGIKEDGSFEDWNAELDYRKTLAKRTLNGPEYREALKQGDVARTFFETGEIDMNAAKSAGWGDWSEEKIKSYLGDEKNRAALEDVIAVNDITRGKDFFQGYQGLEGRPTAKEDLSRVLEKIDHFTLVVREAQKNVDKLVSAAQETAENTRKEDKGDAMTQGPMWDAMVAVAGAFKPTGDAIQTSDGGYDPERDSKQYGRFAGSARTLAWGLPGSGDDKK